MKFVNKFHSNSILPFCICRIKSGSVIQTKHFDIKMSLEIRQAKSFSLRFWVMLFVSFHFFIFSILRITINCNYLFTKHYKYKTLIYLCQRPPPPKKFFFFFFLLGGGGEWLFAVADIFWDAVVSAWLGYSISQMLFRMRWYLQEWGIRYRRCFFDAAVSARVGYSLLRMLFPCHSCIIASAIYLFHDLQILTST